MLISLINLLIIFLLLKKLLFKPVNNLLETRKAQVGKLYDEADAAKTAAEENKARYEEKLSSAHKEALDIVSAAKERASKIGDEIIGEANQKADGMIRRADAEIAQERRRAISEIKGDISSISVGIAEKVIGREIDEKDHKELIDKFISEMGDENE